MNKVISVIAVVLGIFVGLRYIGIYDTSIKLGIDISLIGSIFLVAMQTFHYIVTHITNQGTTVMGKLIKFILAVPGLLHLAQYYFALNLGFDVSIIVAVFLFTEGIYGLH